MSGFLGELSAVVQDLYKQFSSNVQTDDSEEEDNRTYLEEGSHEDSEEEKYRADSEDDDDSLVCVDKNEVELNQLEELEFEKQSVLRDFSGALENYFIQAEDLSDIVFILERTRDKMSEDERSITSFFWQPAKAAAKRLLPSSLMSLDMEQIFQNAIDSITHISSQQNSFEQVVQLTTLENVHERHDKKIRGFLTLATLVLLFEEISKQNNNKEEIENWGISSLSNYLMTNLLQKVYPDRTDEFSDKLSRHGEALVSDLREKITSADKKYFSFDLQRKVESGMRYGPAVTL